MNGSLLFPFWARPPLSSLVTFFFFGSCGEHGLLPFWIQNGTRDPLVF